MRYWVELPKGGLSQGLAFGLSWLFKAIGDGNTGYLVFPTLETIDYALPRHAHTLKEAVRNRTCEQREDGYLRVSTFSTLPPRLSKGPVLLIFPGKGLLRRIEARTREEENDILVIPWDLKSLATWREKKNPTRIELP
jgi:hypothetical protein